MGLRQVVYGCWMWTRRRNAWAWRTQRRKTGRQHYSDTQKLFEIRLTCSEAALKKNNERLANFQAAYTCDLRDGRWWQQKIMNVLGEQQWKKRSEMEKRGHIFAENARTALHRSRHRVAWWTPYGYQSSWYHRSPLRRCYSRRCSVWRHRDESVECDVILDQCKGCDRKRQTDTQRDR